ncbi:MULTISPECIES: alpha/beta fold hydrolase [unclassified Mesorhizobium]|uniref:alpha/beta fold hydrolase n=1 Tax=unclassified Mesorhizobium TaxID=325217 RepID=UPI003014F31B
MNSSPDFSDFFYSAPDGLRLHARIYGADITGSTPVICLPGLTRNARDFHELALFLSRKTKTRRKVVAFDYRGRGESAYDKDWQNYNVAVEAGDILAGLVALGIEHGAFIGTSRGGLIIHVLGAMRPAVLKAVVLNDIGPVLEGAGLAHIRAYLERAPKPKSMADAIAIQRATHGQAFSALTDADWERFVGALYRINGAAPVADFDPALLKTVTGMDLSVPLPVLWPQFEGLKSVPMLAIRGENSKLLSAETLKEMAARHPAIKTITVEGQGHAPLLETGKLPRQIATFLEKADHGA